MTEESRHQAPSPTGSYRPPLLTGSEPKTTPMQRVSAEPAQEHGPRPVSWFEPAPGRHRLDPPAAGRTQTGPPPRRRSGIPPAPQQGWAGGAAEPAPAVPPSHGARSPSGARPSGARPSGAQPFDAQPPGAQAGAGAAPAGQRVNGAHADRFRSGPHAEPLGSGPHAQDHARPPEPAPAGRHAAPRPSTIRLVWIYPDLLSTYGDRGNLLMLKRRARLRGLAVESVEVNADRPVPRQGDIYLLGGGEDLPQILAARRLRADGGLQAVATQGAVIFAVCAGYQLMGEVFGGVQGEPVAGLGILDMRSGRGERRGVGEVVADVDPELGIDRLTGFENHQGVTMLGAAARPLARVLTGVGNGDGTEGAYAGHVLGTYLHGPALVRNPALADLLLRWTAGPLRPLSDAEEYLTRQLRAERLAAVAG